MSIASSKVVFMGSDPIALPLLDWLRREGPRQGGVLHAVFSQPDRPKGRGQKLQPNPVSAWAMEHGLELFRPEKPGEAERDWLEDEGIELVLVMAYGHLLRKSLLAVPPRGFVNFHASLLPKFRGASPIETALASSEGDTGVTLMRIIPKMDAGPICDSEGVRINPLENAAVLRQRLADACVPLLARQFTKLLDGTATFHEQQESSASYCRKLHKNDGALDFTASARDLAARINGLDPWPGCFATHGETRLKFRAASVEETAHQEMPGTVLSPSGSAVRIATGNFVLCIAKLQRPGAKMLPAQDFLRGYDLPEGCVLSSTPMSALVAQEPMRYQGPC